jgi:hypothetical protein
VKKKFLEQKITELWHKTIFGHNIQEGDLNYLKLYPNSTDTKVQIFQIFFLMLYIIKDTSALRHTKLNNILLLISKNRGPTLHYISNYAEIFKLIFW